MAGVRKHGNRWQARWIDAEGKRRGKTFADRRSAERFGLKQEQEVARIVSGLIDPKEAAMALRAVEAISEPLREYRASLEAGGRDSRYIADTIDTVQRCADMVGWAVLRDIDPEGLNRACGAVRARGNGARTVQAMVRAVKGFCNWCVASQRLAFNPVASVKAPSPEKDRRREARILMPEEWPHLRDAAGEERGLLYEVAIQTGYRRNELAALTRASLQSGPEGFELVLRASHTKNGSAARQWVPDGLAERIRQHAHGKTPHAGLFSVLKTASRRINSDLAVARQSWLEASSTPEERAEREGSPFLARENDRGEVFVFHSLRHTCGAWLVMDGINIKTVQAVLRHGTIGLTLDTYGHLMPGSTPLAGQSLEARLAHPWPTDCQLVAIHGNMGKPPLASETQKRLELRHSEGKRIG